MSILNIIKLDNCLIYSKDTSLRLKSRDVLDNEIKGNWFECLIKNMFETLYTGTGVGLAAPQIGFLLKIVIIDIERDGKKPILMINPTYSSIDDKKVLSKESCLSIPGYIGEVERYRKIKVSYTDLQGKIIEKEVEGFCSNVMQHEIDHLDGILYIDRIVDKDKLITYNGYIDFLASKAMTSIKIDKK